MSATTEISNVLEGKLATLRTLQPMLDSITTSDPAITTLKTVLTILTAQMIEFKTEAVGSSINQHSNMVRTVKTEQYSRRNTTILVGLPVDSSESDTSQGKLIDNVVKKLTTVSGVNVKSSDLSAVHRNAKPKASSSTSRPNTRQTPPPSITVCFYNSNLKDNVLMKYSNYDKPKK